MLGKPQTQTFNFAHFRAKDTYTTAFGHFRLLRSLFCVSQIGCFVQLLLYIV